MVVLISVEGVLAEAGEDLRAVGPTPFGKSLYQSIYSNNIAIGLLSTCSSDDIVKNWLTREGFRGYSLLLTAEDSLLDGIDFKIETVKKLISGGHHILYLIDSDPNMVRPMASEYGVSTLLAVHAWAKPGKTADIPYQPWESLVEVSQVEALRKAKLEERRQDGDFGG